MIGWFFGELLSAIAATVGRGIGQFILVALAIVGLIVVVSGCIVILAD